jgi:hypothetical protein
MVAFQLHPHRDLSLRRQLPGRNDLAAPALRAVAALGGTAGAGAVFHLVADELRLGRRADIQRDRKDGRSYARHENDFALHALGKADLLQRTDHHWQITADGLRLPAEGVCDQEIIEIAGRCGARGRRHHE